MAVAQAGAGRRAGPTWPPPSRTQAMPQAQGEFDVNRSDEPSCDMGDGVSAGHYRFKKHFHGALDASSVVHMLAVGTDVPGSAAYVAIERLSGTLDGKA